MSQDVTNCFKLSKKYYKCPKKQVTTYLKAICAVKGNSKPLLKTFFISNFGFNALSGFSGKWNIARKFVSYAKSTNSFSIEIAKGQPKLSIVRIFDFSSILCFDLEYRQIPTTESKSADRTNCALLKKMLFYIRQNV